ncbi:MAG: hypothetical protein R2704_08730 [Microthrixaceae bacterium]
MPSGLLRPVSSAEICATCRELAPLDEEGCARLPRVLLARGADVRAARDPERDDTPGRTGADRIPILRTSHRCEVVVMSGERIVSWHDASALERRPSGRRCSPSARWSSGSPTSRTARGR